MTKKIFFLLSNLLWLNCAFASPSAEIITPPGEWHFEQAKTKIISCQNVLKQEEIIRCQLAKNGPVYELFCPSLEGVDVFLKEIDKSFYCSADKEVCLSPAPCSILEKVVFRPGVDICQHGEVRHERKCLDDAIYKIDAKKDGTSEIKIVDQCCQKKNAFARPGVKRFR